MRVVQTSVVIGAPLPDVDALELAPRLKAESGSRSMAVVMMVTPDSAAHVVETTTDVVRRIFRDYARGKVGLEQDTLPQGSEIAVAADRCRVHVKIGCASNARTCASSTPTTGSGGDPAARTPGGQSGARSDLPELLT